MCLYYTMIYCFLHATRSQNVSQSFSSQHSGCDPLDFEMHLVRKRLCSFADIMSAISSGVASVHAIKNKIIILPPPCVLVLAFSLTSLAHTIDTRVRTDSVRGRLSSVCPLLWGILL